MLLKGVVMMKARASQSLQKAFQYHGAFLHFDCLSTSLVAVAQRYVVHYLKKE